MNKLASRKLTVTLAAAAGLVSGATDFRTAILLTIIVVAYVAAQGYADAHGGQSCSTPS